MRNSSITDFSWVFLIQKNDPKVVSVLIQRMIWWLVSLLLFFLLGLFIGSFFFQILFGLFLFSLFCMLFFCHDRQICKEDTVFNPIIFRSARRNHEIHGKDYENFKRSW